MRQFVDVGAAVALSGGILMAHPGAEVGQLEIEVAHRFELRLERLADVAHQLELFAVGEGDEREVGYSHAVLLLSVWPNNG